eukprot:gene6891-11053_t
MGNLSTEEFDEEEAIESFQKTLHKSGLLVPFEMRLKKEGLYPKLEMYRAIQKFKSLDDEKEREDGAKLFTVKFGKEIPKNINLKEKQFVDEKYYEELERDCLEKLIRSHEKYRMLPYYKQHSENFYPED